MNWKIAFFFKSQLRPESVQNIVNIFALSVELNWNHFCFQAHCRNPSSPCSRSTLRRVVWRWSPANALGASIECRDTAFRVTHAGPWPPPRGSIASSSASANETSCAGEYRCEVFPSYAEPSDCSFSIDLLFYPLHRGYDVRGVEGRTRLVVIFVANRYAEGTPARVAIEERTLQCIFQLLDSWTS